MCQIARVLEKRFNKITPKIQEWIQFIVNLDLDMSVSYFVHRHGLVSSDEVQHKEVNKCLRLFASEILNPGYSLVPMKRLHIHT